jgi:transcriptional regulator with XRE-family HTH domain
MKENIINYIVKNKRLKQKDIAKKLGVTPGQVTKWKNGEHISIKRRAELYELSGYDHRDFSDEEDFEDWSDYIYLLHKQQGFYNREIDDECEFRTPRILETLSKLGVLIPDKAPLVEKVDSDDFEYTNFDSVLIGLFESYSIFVNYLDRYLPADFSQDDSDIWEIQYELEAHSFQVAVIDFERENREGLLSIGVDENLLDNFINSTRTNVERVIRSLLKLLRIKGREITEDYFIYIQQTSEWIDDEMMFNYYQNRTVDFLSYADRNLLETQKYGIRLLESLNRKIDTLLSDKDKQKFRDDPNTLME